VGLGGAGGREGGDSAPIEGSIDEAMVMIEVCVHECVSV
jgi:hypothetical protein